MIDIPWRNFISPEFGTNFQRDVPYFWRYHNFLTTGRGMGRRKLPCQNRLYSFIRFDRTPTCDRQTDRHRHRHRHGAVAGTRASIASPRGKNDISTIYCAEINAFSAYTFSDMTLLVGRQGGHPACKKQWWGAGVVLYLEQGADLHMAPCS